MAAKPKPAKPKPAEEEPTMSLSAEQRRRRVAEVRGLQRELQTIENTLLDAQARLPTLIAHVARVRHVISENTAPVAPEEEAGG